MLSGWQIAPALRERGLLIEDIRDHHNDPRTPDHIWLATVGQRDWIALSRDNDIKHNPLALAAISAAKARMFCLTASKLNAPMLVELIVGIDSLMQEVAHRYSEPFIANVELQRVIHFVRGGCAEIHFGLASSQRRANHKPLG